MVLKEINSQSKSIGRSTMKLIRQSILGLLNQFHRPTIGGPEIKEQALRFAVFLQQPEFTASNGWLQKFCERYHISFKTIVGEAGLVDKSVTDNYLNEILPNLIASYKPEDIFNADETALFYRAQPAKTMIYKDMYANKVKQYKERLT